MSDKLFPILHSLVKSYIVEIRQHPVIVDADVAALYGVETKRVNETVKNNPGKFPEDYMFVLTSDELKDLRSKISTTNLSAKSRSLPKAFTEKGLYMLATILKSQRAKRIREPSPDPNFGPIRWKFTPIWQGNKWNVRVSIALTGTADNKEKAFVIECDYILKMGLGFCICKLGKIVKVIIADIIEEGFFEFSFVADNVKPILRTDKAVNGDDPIFPEAFQVYYDNKTETIDMNTILTNSKRYGYNRYS